MFAKAASERLFHLIRQPKSGCHREIALAIVPSGFSFEGKAKVSFTMVRLTFTGERAGLVVPDLYREYLPFVD